MSKTANVTRELKKNTPQICLFSEDMDNRYVDKNTIPEHTVIAKIKSKKKLNNL